jgi:putative CocE/NonD family hydrolase
MTAPPSPYRDAREDAEGEPYDVRVEPDVPATMRDGTVLRADVVTPVPRRPGETFPTLLTRTPYQKRPLEWIARAGYIAVAQDVRGRYASDGAYEPVHQMCGATVDGPDGYDTALWAAALPGANGRLGVFGTSYPAWEAWELAMTRPAPLQAMYVSGMSVTSTAVEAVPRPGRRVQWFFGTGAPDTRRRLGLPGPQTREAAARLWRYERQKWLWFLPWSELPDYVLGPLTPYFKGYLSRPQQDTFRFRGRHGEVDVPVFHRTGWYDRFVSTIDHFTAMRHEGRDARVRGSQRLLVGPWGHTDALTRRVGDLDFGPAAALDHQTLLLRWFDHWLKDRDSGLLDGQPVRYFLMGRNEWREAPAWPPPGTADGRWYLHSAGRANTAAGDGRLTPAPPDTPDPPDSLHPAPAPPPGGGDVYDYDPRDPVPTIWPLDDQCVPLDQRPLDGREDLLVYVSAPLARELAFAGDPIVELYAASSAPDTDFIARVSDVHPDGLVQPLTDGIVRARFRDGPDRPRLLTPGAVERYRIPLHPVAATLLPGHRLRLDVTSSDFPNYDRNHNTGGDDFSDPALGVARQTVFHTAGRPSALVLPVLPAPPGAGAPAAPA